MFFVHQRGRAMGVYTVFLSLGPFVGGLAGGYIAFNKGWEYTFWVGTALSAFSFVGMAIFVPETLFERPIHQTDQSQEDHVNDSKEQSERIENVNLTEQKHLTFIQSLGFGPVRGNILTFAIRPWKSLYLPGTWVVMLHYAGLVGGVVTISTIGAQLVAEPPYLWGANAGLINIGGLIGTALGYIYTHFTSDRIVRLQVRKNNQHGVTEAEHRLPTMFFPLAITTSGFFVFGFCAQNPGPYRWVGLEAGFAMLSFGLMQVPSVGFNYLVDSYHSLAADCLTMVTILRAIIAFSWTFFVAHWVEERGAAEPFGIFGMLMGIFGLLTVPLWLFGKRMRIATASSVERWSG
ncbi:unnamed protein product [Clonostachys byssicola]|uniref:Major facilitator superfamily (MFS) profile domain-containing protein n=1 Tax=Clonostachys byssicola TaxID=160290 RepID=A0A9N9URN3_9HYPO|nr:unnamed protein product [Clonostachys byssicola]